MIDGETTYDEVAPPAPLQAWVRCVWFLRGPTDGAVQTIVPDGRTELVIHLADAFAQLGSDGRAREQPRVLIAGQLTGPMRLRPGARADIVGIRFRSAAGRAMLGIPQHELTDEVAALRDLLPCLEAKLIDAAATGGPAAARAAAIFRVLGAMARRSIDPVAARALRILDHANAPRIGMLARALGISPRALERRLRDEVGLTPRDLRSVLRFRRAFQSLGSARPGQWGAVAHATGYFDQAHLIRDFRRFSGSSPSQFFGGADHLSQLLLTGD